VAREEKEAFEHAVEGVYGEEMRQRANALGLRGIVEERLERGSGKKSGWEVVDLVTGERFFRLSPNALDKLGWRPYSELEDGERRLVDQQLQQLPPEVAEVARHGWFKREPGPRMVQYEPRVERAEA